ncbi:MAG: hypothetical protein AVDCRST_MAG93-3037, partial [uncultured Chloroflexia bacterium]
MFALARCAHFVRILPIPTLVKDSTRHDALNVTHAVRRTLRRLWLSTCWRIVADAIDTSLIGGEIAQRTRTNGSNKGVYVCVHELCYTIET